MTRTLAAALAGATITYIAVTNLNTPDVQHQLDVQTITRQVITTIDLDELIEQSRTIHQQLTDECLAIIQRWTDEPKAGIIHHVNRRYDGDVCAYADEVVRDRW
jgi:regulator of protease activity HflC (stomatin/prohibitin superfamily)